MKRNRTRIGLLAAIAVVVTAIGGTGTAPQAVAFDNTWFFGGCLNAGTNDTAFFDDSPGAGPGNESVFFWLLLDQAQEERCAFKTEDMAVDTTAHRQLQVRAAVSDGSRLTVAVKPDGITGCLFPENLATITITGTQANSAFRTKSVSLPPGQTVDTLCVLISDDPASAASGRATALIDEIRIWKRSTGAVGFQETFSG